MKELTHYVAKMHGFPYLDRATMRFFLNFWNILWKLTHRQAVSRSILVYDHHMHSKPIPMHLCSPAEPLLSLN